MKNKKLISLLCAALTAGTCSVPAAACSLSKDELIEKYGYLCEITEGVSTNPDIGLTTWAKEKTGAEVQPSAGEAVSEGTFGSLRYALLDSGTVRITGLAADADADTEILQIPAQIEGAAVTEIGYAALKNANTALPKLRQIILPDSVEIIAEQAFAFAFGPEPDGADYAINLPAQIKFIGRRAFIKSAFALAQDHIITLPESLEYISAQAFDDAIGPKALQVKMPDSLVFLSDDYFHTDGRWRGTGLIDAVRAAVTVPESAPAEEQEFGNELFGKGFVNGEANIISMKEILWDYLGTNETDSTVEAEISDSNLHEIYTLLAGDVTNDGTVNIQDAVYLNRVVSETDTLPLDAVQAENADLDQDGVITVADLTGLLQMLK